MYLFIVAIDIVPMWWKNSLIIIYRKEENTMFVETSQKIGGKIIR